MSKSKSTGRARLDKYYSLAKEKGYRARSAFKLIQMNRRYKFLENAHILVDLCAAPGGWLQVAAQEMPPVRKIVGVDLEPIKFIGDVDTFVADITTEDCRIRLREILGRHKSDVILHDGAPNVGTSWESDAFNQNLLVLHSARLATEFLREGGVFVTKVFRSQDYAALFGMFTQMFGRVETSKPLSSRTQSAEIFLVCLDFVGGERVDQSMLDPTAVFQEMKSPGGYDGFNFYKTVKFTSFMREERTEALVQMLSEYSEIVVDMSPSSVSQILEDEFLWLFKDLQVISKGDVRRIIKKRKKIAEAVRSGEVCVPELEFLREMEECSSWQEDVEQTVEEKLSEIERLMERRRRQEDREERRRGVGEDRRRDWFFSDSMFDKLREIGTEETPLDVGDGDDKDMEVSSCSDSLDLSSEEMMCIAKLKDNPSEFVEDTIDRYIRDPEEKLPNYLREDQDKFYGRRSKGEVRLSNKEREALNRRKTRAERRAEKFMKDVMVDDSEEEGKIAKKVYKSSFKKTKTKPRVVFPKRGRCGVPKGKGRIVAVDRRMKKDKRRR